MLFLGVDWGEHHHDLCLLHQDGAVLAARRILDGLTGVGELHALLASHAEDPAQVVVDKRAVPKERVRLDTETVTEERQVADEVRKEQIEVEGDVDRR